MVEDRLRYTAAEPLIAGDLWVAIGADDAASDVLAAHAGRVLLVGPDRATLDDAAAHAKQADVLVADLADPAGIADLRERLATHRAFTVTCFGVLDRLATFVPLADLLGELADRHDATIVLDVPNDTFAGDTGGAIVWGESAFEELRRLLPGEPVVAHQVALGGSMIVRDPAAAPAALPAVAPDADAPPTHLIAAFGPRAADLQAAALAEVAPRAADRRRILELEAEAAVLRARLERHEGRAARPA